MKSKAKTLDQRPWAPGCFITGTGLVLSKEHVINCRSTADAKAVIMTTHIIERMIKL